MNTFDPIESVIFEKGLKIRGVHFYEDLDLMIIVLNNKKILARRISQSPKLADATSEALAQYELPGKGAAIHWPAVDEDLSLKGLLAEEIVKAGPLQR